MLNFRAKALLKLQSPDQLDQRVKVVRVWAWAALGGLLTIVASTVTWASLASLPTSISATGYVIPAEGWSNLQSPVSGVVTAVDAGADHPVARGQVVATVTSGSTVTQVRAVQSGYLAEASVTVGEYVQAGDQVAIVSSTAGAMVVHAFFPIDMAREIAPGVATQIALSTPAPVAFGYVRGRVVSVSSLPATEGHLTNVLLNPTLAQQVMARGPVVDVLINLDRASTPSGYSWSLGKGPQYSPLTGGLPTKVSIVVARQHPIQYIF